MTELYLGLLSGTSMDAIDVAAFDFSQSTPQMIAKLSVELPAEYKSQYKNLINSGQCTIKELGELDHWTGDLFANAVLKFLELHNLKKESIKAIGSHGQTLWHAPNAEKPFTLQIGDPNIIAIKTGLTTVADFRRADMAAEGQGAPFAPAFHQAMFSNPQENRFIVNIGGISNISVLTNNTVFGFDIGPGNCLMDGWVKENFNLDYDKDGEIAQTGTINSALLSAFLDDPYFSKPPPKSTGREYFSDAWLQNKIKKSAEQQLKTSDVLATLLELTAQSISLAIKNLKLNNYNLFICGGGAKNLYLCQSLIKQIDQTVQTTEALGIDLSWVEAGLFAWLAKQRLDGKAVDLRSITGAKQAVILGGVYG